MSQILALRQALDHPDLPEKIAARVLGPIEFVHNVVQARAATARAMAAIYTVTTQIDSKKPVNLDPQAPDWRLFFDSPDGITGKVHAELVNVVEDVMEQAA